ncbi:hypothetical protein [Pseudomonas sp. Irchel 3A18]|uniref:hypothetical protein n=1 Tax=Pseudomonas sp. Irchel 3A18 TaxID=2008905 RepID=UPI0021141E04|nr:hypothetical protein [Pseudomonas sp. Irchel 3A18]
MAAEINALDRFGTTKECLMFYPREAEKDNLFNRVILLTFACCAILFLASLARHQGSTYAVMQLGAVQVSGSVKALENIPRNSMGKIIHYRYVDEEGEAHDDQYFDPRYDENTHYEVGDAISLVYSSWFTGKNAIASELHTYRPDFYILSGGLSLALILLLISLWTIRRIYVLKQEDRVY